MMFQKITCITFSCLFSLVALACKTSHATNTTVAFDQEAPKDSVAERMLIYQRDNGGWPQPGGDAINYEKVLSPELKKTLLSEKKVYDTTIDDKATTREINWLVTAYKKTKNPAYIKAAERGIAYLIDAQNKAGGWGQFFPDTSGYHKHITYNDNAMIDVMTVMKRTADGLGDFTYVDKNLVPQAKKSLEKGIQCILKTQYVQHGKLTAWCAQHDRVSLLPAKARKFELPSLSGGETVGILNFLMDINNPSPAIKKAINAGAAWLESAKLVGIKVVEVKDPSQPRGKDRIVTQDPTSTIWARFYDLDTNKPFFTGRDSVPRANLADIENERRAGYAYYGSWPAKLLATDYPAWLAKWGK